MTLLMIPSMEVSEFEQVNTSTFLINSESCYFNLEISRVDEQHLRLPFDNFTDENLYVIRMI